MTDRFFLTTYYEPYTGLRYGLTIRASSENGCQSIMDAIRLDFTGIEGEVTKPGAHRLFTWAKKREKAFEAQLPAVLHHACFVGFIAMRLKGGPDPGILLSDTRCLHSIAHRLQFGFRTNDPDSYDMNFTRDALVTDISTVEQHVPWLWSSEELAISSNRARHELPRNADLPSAGNDAKRIFRNESVLTE